MASGGLRLKMNRRAVYQILMFPKVETAMKGFAGGIQKAASGADDSGDYEVEAHTTTKYPRRRTARVVNRDELGWVTEFGSYGGKRISYDIIPARGPHPGFTDEGGPSRMQRSTGRRTGVVKAKFPLSRAALAARGTIEYKPDKVD